MLHTVSEVDTWEMHKYKKGDLQFSARHFVCGRCTVVGDGTEKPTKVVCDEVKIVRELCYLVDRLNASGGCETAVTSRVRIG